MDPPEGGVTQEDILQTLLHLVEAVHEYDVCKADDLKYTQTCISAKADRVVVKALAYVTMRAKSDWAPPSKKLRLGEFFVAVDDAHYESLRRALDESHQMSQHPDWYTASHTRRCRENVHLCASEHAPHRRGVTSDPGTSECVVQ